MDLEAILEPLSHHLCPKSFSILIQANNKAISEFLLQNPEPTFSSQDTVRDLRRAEYHQDKLKYFMVDARHVRLHHGMPVLMKRDTWTSLDYYSAWQRFKADLEPRPVLAVFKCPSKSNPYQTRYAATDHYYKACKGLCSCIDCLTVRNLPEHNLVWSVMVTV